MTNKHTMDDMVPKKRRSLSRLKPVSTHTPHKHREAVLGETTEERQEQDETRNIEEDMVETSPLGLTRRPPREPLTSAKTPSPKGGRFGLWVSVGVAVVLVLGYGATFFTRVTATITPKTKEENITTGVRLSRLSQGDTASTSTLAFDVYYAPAEKVSETLESTGTEKISKKASGEIIIFNEYDKKPVTLIANTRFLASNGNIYRLKDQVLVPGMKTQGGKTIPGSLTVRVYADKAGASYNIKLTDFTIPGFKGKPQETKVYARSKTEMTGGFEGDSPVVSETALSAARERLKAQIVERLNKRQSVEIPAGYFVIPGATSITWTEEETVQSDDAKKVVFEVRGESAGLLVKKESLGTLLSGTEGYSLSNAEKLTFSLENPDTTEMKNLKTGTLHISGTAHFVAIVPEGAIANAMLGKKKKDLQAFFEAYPSVEEAKIRFFPSWARTVPNDPNRVSTELTEPTGLDE